MPGGQVEIVEIAIGSPPRRMFIVDNLLQPEAAAAIFVKMRNLAYTFDDADREDTQDYNHFKHDFPLGPDEADPTMLLLAEKAREVLGSQGVECGGVYRIYANFNLFGDFQFAHEDGEGWTALLFANPEWRDDWGGEFTAYPDDGTPFAYSITPRPGRMVIFDGMIRHRGGVPSKFCFGPRISVAIKFERDRIQ